MNEHIEIPVTLGDGNTYPLRYNYNAIALAESVGRKDFGEINYLSNVGGLRLMLWAGLQHHEEHSKLNIDQIGNLMDGASIESMVDSVVRAVGLALNGPEFLDTYDRISKEMEEGQTAKKKNRSQSNGRKPKKSPSVKSV